MTAKNMRLHLSDPLPVNAFNTLFAYFEIDQIYKYSHLNYNAIA